MLLRRLTQHVKDQNWFAVGLDFLIVVFGVFMGIQLGNWNDARALDAREDELLRALRTELENSISVTQGKIDAFTDVGEAAARSLDFLESGNDCAEACWPIVIDFFHASQWQTVQIRRSTFQEMRREALPRSRTVIDAIEAYHAQNDGLTGTAELIPAYRALVRSHIPLAIHDAYWAACFRYEDGIEYYSRDCPPAVPADLSARAIVAIKADRDTVPMLTEWAGFARSIPATLVDEVAAAERAIAAIDAELGASK